MTLDCELPAYIGRKQPPLPVSGVMQIPMGSRVTVHAAAANKELVGVQVNSVVDDRPVPVETLDEQRAGRRSRGFLLRVAAADERHDAAVHADRRRRHQQPRSGAAGAGADARPAAADGRATRRHRHGHHAAGPRPRGRAESPTTTASAACGSSTRSTSRSRASTSIRRACRSPRPISTLADAALEVRELALKPGQKLLVSVKAADLCDLGRRPERRQQRAMAARRGHARAVAGDARGPRAGVAAAVRADDPGDDRDARPAGAARVCMPSQSRDAKPVAPSEPASSEPGDDEPADSPARQRDVAVAARARAH